MIQILTHEEVDIARDYHVDVPSPLRLPWTLQEEPIGLSAHIADHRAGIDLSRDETPYSGSDRRERCRMSFAVMSEG